MIPLSAQFLKPNISESPFNSFPSTPKSPCLVSRVYPSGSIFVISTASGSNVHHLFPGPSDNFLHGPMILSRLPTVHVPQAAKAILKNNWTKASLSVKPLMTSFGTSARLCTFQPCWGIQAHLDLLPSGGWLVCGLVYWRGRLGSQHGDLSVLMLCPSQPLGNSRHST